LNKKSYLRHIYIHYFCHRNPGKLSIVPNRSPKIRHKWRCQHIASHLHILVNYCTNGNPCSASIESSCHSISSSTPCVSKGEPLNCKREQGAYKLHMSLLSSKQLSSNFLIKSSNPQHAASGMLQPDRHCDVTLTLMVRGSQACTIFI